MRGLDPISPLAEARAHAEMRLAQAQLDADRGRPADVGRWQARLRELEAVEETPDD